MSNANVNKFFGSSLKVEGNEVTIVQQVAATALKATRAVTHEANVVTDLVSGYRQYMKATKADRKAAAREEAADILASIFG